MTIASEAGRFYLHDGSPFTQVEMKTKPGQMRDANVKDARAAKAEPSVSTVLKAAAAPGLVKWMVDSALNSALTLPRLPDESLDAFKARALLDSQEQAKLARERGTELHGAIERYMLGQPYDGQFEPHIQSVKTALLKEGIDLMTGKPERSFCLPGQYGGKSDTFSTTENWLIDHKGVEDSKLDGKLGFQEHIRGLAAYANGWHLHKPRLINVFIGRSSGQVKLKEWTHEEAEHALAEFLALLRFYRLSNGFPV